MFLRIFNQLWKLREPEKKALFLVHHYNVKSMKVMVISGLFVIYLN